MGLCGGCEPGYDQRCRQQRGRQAAGDASPAEVDAAVALNEEARLSALKLGLLILSGVSAIAIVPASRLPRYLPGEIPESVATGREPVI